MTFQELMDSYYISEEDNNQITYNKLLTFAQTKNITPVIGAGLSHWAYPLWKEMLEQQAKNYGLTEEISSLQALLSPQTLIGQLNLYSI